MKKLSNQEKLDLQGNTVIPIDYIPGGKNPTWRRKYTREGYFALQCVKTDKFLTAINDSVMNITGRFLVIYWSFFGSFRSYLI